ncbi:MAG TPA: phosphoribosylpyrophosphate synthetase [Ohtaekwangia sp.]|nr:phosphoribosylpyrophosphate synthetase [Ohtaekwangia sp.]
METYETLSEAMNALKAAGYNEDFNLHPEWIESSSSKLRLNPEEFHIDSVHRFEGMTNPSDSAVLYAISSTQGAKGLLVDAYGAYADSISPVMIEKLRIDSNTGTGAEERSAEKVKRSELKK